MKQLRMELPIPGKPEEVVNVEGRVCVRGHGDDLSS